MQRQSLGSPSTKLHLHHHLHEPSSSSPLKSLSNGEIVQVEEEDEVNKKLKLKKPINSPSNTKPESYIHLIPMLTLLCFVILYLSSHNPSPNDMAQFNVYSHNLPIHEEIGDSIPEMEMKKGEIVTIRSLKNIGGGGLGKHRRLHRKFAIV